MEKNDIIELATFCTNKCKEVHSGKTNDRYTKTLYVSISKDNNVQCSITPHVLQNAYQCILIHYGAEFAIKQWYAWYEIQFINADGIVYDSNFGDEFNMVVNSYNYSICLCYGKEKLFWIEEPFEGKIHKLWELYIKLKDVKSLAEMKLIADLFKKDDKILKLENQIENFTFTEHLLRLERDQYKELLDKIKDTIK